MKADKLCLQSARDLLLALGEGRHVQNPQTQGAKICLSLCLSLCLCVWERCFCVWERVHVTERQMLVVCVPAINAISLLQSFYMQPAPVAG